MTIQISETEKRTLVLHVRLTPDEFRSLARRAKAEGVTAATCVRALLFHGGKVRVIRVGRTK
jgi:hypothetical protein